MAADTIFRARHFHQTDLPRLGGYLLPKTEHIRLKTERCSTFNS